MEGREYVVYIADGRDNDVDFTNDGLAIDLDHNGKIDRQQQRFHPATAVHLNGKSYTFRVTW